jgi:hypothetical protein
MTHQVMAPEGHVIVGVRFQKYDQYIYLQPQVARLIDFKTVDPNSTYWLELDFYYRIFSWDTPSYGNGPQFLLGNFVLPKDHYAVGKYFFTNFGANLCSVSL